MPASKVEIHPEALAEAEAAFAWYAERSDRAPAALVAEIDRAIASIVKAPHSWPLHEGNCRRFALTRFPYLVVYREKAPGWVQIVAIAHGVAVQDTGALEPDS
jgi:plasmid stabilization system protein ParE